MLGHSVGAVMLLICFALLGAAASRGLRLPGLIIVVSLLAVAIGVEGAMNHRALATVLLNAVVMLAVVELAYFFALMLGNRGAKLLSYWKA